jgi:hypothetical protein
MSCKPALEEYEQAEEAYEATGQRLFELLWRDAEHQVLRDLMSVEPELLRRRIQEHHGAFARKREARKARIRAISHHV